MSDFCICSLNREVKRTPIPNKSCSGSVPRTSLDECIATTLYSPLTMVTHGEPESPPIISLAPQNKAVSPKVPRHPLDTVPLKPLTNVAMSPSLKSEDIVNGMRSAFSFSIATTAISSAARGCDSLLLWRATTIASPITSPSLVLSMIDVLSLTT